MAETKRDQTGASRMRLFPLYGAGFVTAFGAHAVAANLGVYATGHRATLLELGLLLAVYDGAEVLLKPVFGALADRVGAKPVLLGGLVGFAAASAVFVVANEPAFLGVARLAQGASAAAFSPAAGALVALLGGSRSRGRSFGGYGAAKGLGYLAGPLIGGGLVVLGGYRLLFVVLAALAAGVAVVCGTALPAVVPVTRARETLLGLARRWRRPEFIGPVAGLAAATAALSSGVGFLPVAGARAGLGPLATGAIVSAMAASVIVVQVRAGRELDTGRLPVGAGLGGGLLLCSAGLILAGTWHGAVPLLVAALSVGTGVGVATPLGFAALAAAAPAGRLGQTMGAAEVGRELGDAGGPLVVGALASVTLGVGLASLGGLCAVFAILAARSPTLDRPPPVPPAANPEAGDG